MSFEQTITSIWHLNTSCCEKQGRSRLSGRVALAFALLVIFSLGGAGPRRAVAASSDAGGPSTSPNLKVAFIGDGGLGERFRSVLELIQFENADMVIHSGDFDYQGDPAAWDAQISSVLGRDFPYFACIGNHDRSAWPGYQQKLRERLARVRGAQCTGDLGTKSACTYRGLFFLLTAAGMLGPGHAEFIRDQLTRDSHVWSISSWHYNQTAMQVGEKGDQAGWDVYEESIQGGVIIATAHEHSYARTRTLTSAQSQVVDSTCPDPNSLCVAPGRSFVFHSGLGGKSIRHQLRCLPTTFPYGCHGEWASIYTSDQGAKPGALFIAFHVDGDPHLSRGYFKNVDGEVIDFFTITAPASARWSRRLPAPPRPRWGRLQAAA